MYKSPEWAWPGFSSYEAQLGALTCMDCRTGQHCPHDGPVCYWQDQRSSPTLPEKTGVLSLFAHPFRNRSIEVSSLSNSKRTVTLGVVFPQSIHLEGSINMLFISISSFLLLLLFFYFFLLWTADSSPSIVFFSILCFLKVFSPNKYSFWTEQ